MFNTVGVVGSLSSSSITGELVHLIVDTLVGRVGGTSRVCDVGACRELFQERGPRGDIDTHLALLVAADIIVAGTPAMNGSYSGAFKMFFDAAKRESIAQKRIVLCAVGGTLRHTMMIDCFMRPMFQACGSEPVPTSIFAIRDELKAPAKARLRERIEKAADEVEARLSAGPRRDRSNVVGANTVRILDNILT